MFRRSSKLQLCFLGCVLSLLVLSNGGRAWASGPALMVNASAAQQYPISPYIYGIGYNETHPDEAFAADLRLPVHRWGGNDKSRYNWKIDASNHALDYLFSNITEYSGTMNNSAANRLIDQDQRTGTATMLTAPIIGWMTKSGDYACAFSIAKYGTQKSRAAAGPPWSNIPNSEHPDCGTGIYANGSFVVNDPTDTSFAIDPTWNRDWINYLTARYGSASAGGVKFWDLDNEPTDWPETHRDVQPTHLTAQYLVNQTIPYAAAIKAADPGVLTLGPSDFGWAAYFYSSYDLQQGYPYPEYVSHGSTPQAAWYLQQMKAYQDAHNVRLLDYFDEHYYPDADGYCISLCDTGDAANQAKRLEMTRSLWDPTFASTQFYIDQPIQLIPRMKGWVNQNYPGTKSAITEYNFGGTNSLNGALTQADVLGIFGRERLDLATFFESPNLLDGAGGYLPAAFAFRMYRNYDGSGAQFGDTGVLAQSENQSQLSVYGALRSGNTLTLMIINKTGGDLSSSLSLTGFNPASVGQVYRYSAANLNAILRQPDLQVGAGGFTTTFPASSITLIAIPAGVSTGPIDTIGIYRKSSSTFYLRNSNAGGNPDIVVSVGDSNSYPLIGDWDGDGYDTVGIFNQKYGFFSLYNSNASGAPIGEQFILGNPNDVPISGHWITTITDHVGRSHDGVGVHRPSNGLIYLSNNFPAFNANIYADYVIVLGNPDDRAIAGKWIGNPLDTAAVFRPSALPSSRFYITNLSCDGLPPGPNTFCQQFSNSDTFFGLPDDLPVKGDWIGQGKDGFGVFRPSTAAFFLKNTFPTLSGSTSTPDLTFVYGSPGDIPVAGHWLPAGGAPPTTQRVMPAASATRTPVVPGSGGDGAFD